MSLVLMAKLSHVGQEWALTQSGKTSKVRRATRFRNLIDITFVLADVKKLRQQGGLTNNQATYGSLGTCGTYWNLMDTA